MHGGSLKFEKQANCISLSAPWCTKLSRHTKTRVRQV